MGASMSVDDEAARERARLEAIAADSWYSKGLNTASMLYSAKVFARHWRGPRCLEMGPAEGVMTAVLAEAFPDLTVVEGAERFCRELAVKHPRANVVCSIFETFEPTQHFETIVLGHVLEHVDDPRGLLRRVASWLAPGGVVCAAVPNARSLHRQAAVLMGMLPTEHSLNETDVHHGHRRVYDPDSFQADVLAAGLTISTFGGYWLKPLANAQLEATWTPAMLDAFMELGERYPEIAAVMYVIAG
jgi:2-polyprenyl-3-methyl-5-hydroxy-6-metoxy-1,4-benzoquinol methylase